ncbi:vitellogenin-1-like [Haematobia irritans]|uniref:vitellogenin-1-like n=1 Tax=Haematobia irritans TaxID=7368 RepID=UPI003F4FECA5
MLLKLQIVVAILLIACGYYGINGRFVASSDHVLEELKSLASGVGRSLKSRIPSPRELLHSSKQVLIGLPERAVFGAFHKICSIYLESDKINPRISPNISDMWFQLRTPCHNVSFNVQEAEKILESPHFDLNKKVVVFVSGWTTTLNSSSVAHLAKAYNCRGDYNFIAVNASDYIDTIYTWSAFNTDEMGRIVAIGLEKLTTKIPMENIHLVGFSLGAHIVDSAGRYFYKSTGKRFTRITGLDPANPCFNEGEYLSGLQRGDAEFVDVIHTNPGGLGKRSNLGDVDFYAGGYSNVKPGCNLFSCSHQRAWRYYGESVYPGHEMDFMATRCKSLRKVDNGKCSTEAIPMGFEVMTDVKGVYVVGVNAKSPFGRNANPDDDIIQSNCGLCDSE